MLCPTRKIDPTNLLVIDKVRRVRYVVTQSRDASVFHPSPIQTLKDARYFPESE